MSFTPPTAPALVIDAIACGPRLANDPRLVRIRAGGCTRCPGSVAPADVTTFVLLGTTVRAGYRPEAWEGFRCPDCGNEIAIAKRCA